MEIHSANHSPLSQSGFFTQVDSTNRLNPQRIEGSGSKGKAQEDSVSISDAAREKSKESQSVTRTGPTETSQTGEELTREELLQLSELKARDAEVRAHEQAHLAAAGGHATGGPTYTFEKGPDGRSYAVGGEVGIDISKESDPSATIQKMQTVQRAALAPANPSATDRQVAAQASVKEAQARQELLKEQQEELASVREDESKQQVNITESENQQSEGVTTGSLKASIEQYEKMSAL